MMRNIIGFSLIECLVYCVVLGLLSITISQYFSNMCTRIHCLSAEQKEIFIQASVHQLLLRDFQSAEVRKEYWYCNGSHIICHVGSDSIGWYLQDSNLYRSKGRFNFLGHVWEERHTALVAEKVNHFDSMLLNDNATIEAVSYTIGTAQMRVSKTVFLFNMVDGIA